MATTRPLRPRPAAAIVGHGPTRSAARRQSDRAAAPCCCATCVVLRKHLGEFVLRTLVQPFLLVLRLPLRLPEDRPGRRRRHGPGGRVGLRHRARRRAWSGISIMFQGVQSVALQMAQEFGFTREIEDRVQAPCPIWLVAIAKVLSGAVQGLISAAIVLPIASVVHAAGRRGPHLSLHWWIILTVVPLACVAMAALGPGARHRLRAAQHRPDVRLHHPAHHLPRRHLLPVDPARPGQGRRLPLAPDARADQPADLRQRGDAGRLHRRRRTCTSTSSTRC